MRMRKPTAFSFPLMAALAVTSCNSVADLDGAGKGKTLGGSGGARASALVSRRLADVGYVGGAGTAESSIPGDFTSVWEPCCTSGIGSTWAELNCLCYGRTSRLPLPCGFVTTNGDSLACYALPKGSYAQSCRNCRFSLVDGQGRLSCECIDFKGKWKAQSSPLVISATNCAHVSNYDGILTCAAETSEKCEFAGGSFIRSCANCTMHCDETPTMSCVCVLSTTPSTIAPSTCENSQVTNRFGTLECEQVDRR